MEGKQLSLFPNLENQKDKNYHKKAKLGRYEKIQYELNNNDSDPYKKFIKIEEKPILKSDYKFIDLFCGAGGMTQGLVQAGFKPIASVEENSIASATHRKNF
ncbi:MAG: DNA cytosine methyltransferase, partial [Okeania sp. SIO3C4]|nr:DNA cytosine methyltransferase [Okeania sp. SIO3C4]